MCGQLNTSSCNLGGK